MSELDYDIEFVKQEMCSKMFRRRNGTCTLCSKCGDSSASYCVCVKRRYMNKLTEEDVRQYLEDKKSNEFKRLNNELEKKKKEVLELENRLKNF